MLTWRPLLPVLLQYIVTLAPVRPMTSYTQMNHDEPTNAVKETTMTSDQEDFRAPGVGEKDLLWDHVGDLSQHFTLGGGVRESTDGPSTTKEFEELNTTVNLINQIENRVGNTNHSLLDFGSKYTIAANITGNENIVEGRSMTPSHLLLTTSAGERRTELEERFNYSDVQGKLILYPNERKTYGHNFGYAIANFTKNLSQRLKANRTSKSSHRPKETIYDKSDPFSVIFGEVKTEFKTEKSVNVSKENIENAVGGLGIKKVQDILKEEDLERENLTGKESATTFNSFAVHSFEEERDQYGSEQEEEELRKSDKMTEFGRIKSSPHDKTNIFTRLRVDSKTIIEDEKKVEGNQNENSLYKEWDTVSEEQEKMLENMVLQGQNHLEGSSRDALPPSGRWFILLLAGNSTIVKLRQKDFAKYLKLNLAARLSLEYDEIKVNRVVFAPPRLMVNVSVVPVNEGNHQDLDEEIDLEDNIFGEDEAPLHKLAETNATLLELSGEEYHVVRFLSLRSQLPIQMEDSPSETSMIVNDRHMDIEMVIYVAVGGTCAAAILVTFFFALYRYLRTAPINWPWKGAKPRFPSPWSQPRHQRMGEEQAPPIGGPLTVIYSGNFVDRTAPNSGSWIDDYQSSSVQEPLEVPRQQPVYGFGALSNTALPEISDSYSNIGQGSPRFNLDRKLHILGCRPNHYLLPHQPARVTNDHKATLDVRIQGVGVDNPNYQS